MTIEIVKGWRFMSADFSIQASGRDTAPGNVSLVRSPEEKTRWHDMPEELKFGDDNGPPLYVVGYGMTLEQAITDANLKASLAKRIPGKEVPMEFNTCETCRASDGRAGNLINGECLNCHDTRHWRKLVIHENLSRTEVELQRTFGILN